MKISEKKEGYSGSKIPSAWETLNKDPDKYQGYRFPTVTVTVPTFNSARSIARTLDSIFLQQYSDLDVIVVDAGSTDRTLAIVRNYYGDRVRVYSVTSFNLYEMINKGIALAKGQYVNFLCPGFFYINKDILQGIMSMAIDHEMPHLVYGAALLRDSRSDAKILFRPMAMGQLKKGKQPTSLGACWFRKDLFRKLGMFRLDLGMRGGFDMMCRFLKYGKLEAVSTSRVMIDQELRPITRASVWQHFWETLDVVYRHFGVLMAIRWMLRQRDCYRIIQLWFRSIKIAFSGRVGT